MSSGGKFYSYILEPLSPAILVLYGVKRVIYSGKTKYQKVDILETQDYGLALLLDGIIQSAELDEHIYHECLVHPILLTHPNPERVLVIGGGEGSTVREVERHRGVKKITMVDLDGELIELVKKYLPWSLKAFEDPRLNLVISEGRGFLESLPDGSYDALIVDVTDPVEGGPALKLYTKEFYETTYRKLSDKGIMVTQASSASHTTGTFLSIARTISEVFPKSCVYSCYIKSFCSTWGFAVGSKNGLPSELDGREIERRIKERGVEGLRFYSGKIHESLFTLTQTYLNFWKAEGKVITD